MPGVKRFFLRSRNDGAKLLYELLELRHVVIDIFVAVLRIER
jgi:hypothetical protein